MSVVHPTLRNLVKDERGNILMTFGLASMIAVAAVGGSIDYGRAVAQKAKMQQVMDAAIVTAMAKYQESKDWAAAQEEGKKIFLSVYANATVLAANASASQRQAAVNSAALDQPVVQFTTANGSIQGTAQSKVSSPFFRLVTSQDLKTIASSTGATSSGKQLEVALMVDLTGSMGWAASGSIGSTPCNIVPSPNNKIEFLKCAGEDLLNILLPASGANDSAVKIGIAPFADYVNAGEYASKVVDPVAYPATGGTYSPVSNLANTRQGPFTGSYSGSATTAAGQSTGSQFGSMGSTPVSGATNTAAGATFANNYCVPATYAPSDPVPGTINSTLQRWNNGSYNGGIRVTVTGNGTKPTSVLDANSSSTNSGQGRRAYSFWQLTLNSGQWTFSVAETLNDIGEYYVPIVTAQGSATPMSYQNSPVGVALGSNSNARSASSRPAGISRNTTGYWKVTTFNTATQTWDYTWVAANNELYVRLHTGVETGYVAGSAGGTHVGCEPTPTTSQAASSKLITCVTERRNGTDLDFTAEAIGTGRYVGPYNNGSTSASNYSSDGKCWSSGREMPAVIPLTNSRTTLTSFFQTATVGGATAGHLGTAWASYILSPNFATVWPDRVATSYTNTNVQKVAILMTDGEYNIQFATGGVSANTSAKQALMLCKEMRDRGIKVFTVGFGFSASVSAPNVEAMSASQRITPATSGTAQQRAIDTLAKCASDNSSYYFPYDGESLRTVFKNIATTLNGNLVGGKARLTN